jgi:FKBP-type peptidyl-prolyl cis-trans isomerase SlyD
MSDGTTVRKDHVISIEYTLRDGADRVLDSSESTEPLAYLHGHGQIIQGLESTLEGATVGDDLDLVVPPDEGYGDHDPEQVFTVPRAQFAFGVKAGDIVRAEREDGASMPLQVVGVDDNEVTLDGNHPLAGKTLYFNVKVVGVRPATEEELSHGHAH